MAERRIGHKLSKGSDRNQIGHVHVEVVDRARIGTGVLAAKRIEVDAQRLFG
jgi:hypothetical protein